MRIAAIFFAGTLLAGCQSDSESGATGVDGGATSNGGASSGGTMSNGGAPAAGGGATSNGGVGAGGASNGGASGGSNAGGASNGGASGGPNAGGASNGGASGGPNAGGAPNGGASGGTSTGGTSSDGGGTPCPAGKPDATNTGVPPGVSLTVVSSDVTVTQDNTTIDAEDIHGFLVIRASHVRVTRCIVRGGVATQNGDGIRVQSGTDVLIEDTEVAIANPSPYLDGIAGSNMTVRRANIHGGVDGMKLGSNSTVECSYIHDEVSFASDPNQGGGPTHNDAIQILSGTEIHIVGNTLLAAKDQNSAIQITQDFGVVTDVFIDGNWADGGGCTFNISHKGAASLTGIYVTNNRFGRNSFYGCPILKSTQTTAVLTGNVYDDDGSPVPVQTHD